MSTSTTTNKGLTKVTVGTEVGTWGPYINSDMDIIDKALGGTVSYALSSSNQTVSSTDAQNQRILLTGTLTANINLVFPSGVGGDWVVTNSTANSGGPWAVTATTGSGLTTVVTQGVSSFIYSDGTNVQPAVSTSLTNNSVSNSILAQAPAYTIKGNPTSSTANVQDASLTTFLDTISATQGVVLYRSASGWVALSPGTSGQFLQTQGASNNPQWATPSGSFLIRAPQILTSGTSYTTPSNCTKIYVELVGAGGGGGSSPGGGGGGGGYTAKYFTVTPSTAYTYAIGSAGAVSNNGGATTFTVGATTITGGGGAAGASGAGGGGGGVGSGGDLNITGGGGGPGGAANYPLYFAGNGGSSFFGGGGSGATSQSNSNPSPTGGPGGNYGGGGAANSAGAAGVIRIWEYT